MNMLLKSCTFAICSAALIIAGCGGGSGGLDVDIPVSDYEPPDTSMGFDTPLSCTGEKIWAIATHTESNREAFISEGAGLIQKNGTLFSEITRQCAVFWEYDSEERCSLLFPVAVDENPKFVKSFLDSNLYSIENGERIVYPPVYLGGESSFVTLSMLYSLPDCENSVILGK